MAVTIIVGGQFGSEGKGKAAYFFAKKQGASVAVRVGGPNSGHTVVDDSGGRIILRQLPTPSLLPNVVSVLPAGSYLSLDVLLTEIDMVGLNPDRLIIDPNAVIIDDDDREAERNASLREKIGSTLSGTGAAVWKRIRRTPFVRFAKDMDNLGKFIRPAVQFMRGQLRINQRIIIEGTQGFGLSPLHSPHHPFVTSRDTTAAGFVSETGLSPLDVDEVVLVLRAFPIRVAGNSGPLSSEIDWQTISYEARSTEPLVEYTSVTNAIRRVARFTPEIVRQAIATNAPTCIVMNHLDHIDATCRTSHRLTQKTSNFMETVERLIDARIDYFGFDPKSLVPRSQLL
jgi:adenylosuccinate synthase